jgi:tight adherence protein B
MRSLSILTGLVAGIFVYLLLAVVTGNMPNRFSNVMERKQRQSRREKMQSWLNQSGVGVTPVQFWSISVGILFSTFVIVYVVTQVFFIALAPAVMVGLLPRAYFANKRSKINEKRLQAWPDALRTLIASIASSQSLHQALKGLSFGGPVPLRPVFKKYSQLSQALDQKSALEVVKEDLADPMSDRIIEILISATEAGPAVVLDILRDLAQSCTHDLQLNEHIETMQTEQKINAKAVFVLPFLLLILMVIASKEVGTFYSSFAGVLVVVVGTAILSLGMFIVNRLGHIPSETRVFAASYEDIKEDVKTKKLSRSSEKKYADSSSPFGDF